jgi:hypothetical protein
VGDPRVVTVLASARACDRIADLAGACRISAGEVMIVGDVSVLVLERAVRHEDPDAVVLDVSDGWSLVRLEGPRAAEAFARLSALELPPAGFVQGDVAGLPARVLVGPVGIDVLVPSMVGDSLRERVDAECRELLP